MRRAWLLLALIGCDGNTGPTEPAAEVEVLAGAGQRAPVTTELPEPVVVRLVDAEGRAVARHPVSFVVVDGEGSVVAETDRTDGDGEARARWTLGTRAGDQMIEAQAINQETGEPIVVTLVTALAEPGPVVALIQPTTRHTSWLRQTFDIHPFWVRGVDAHDNDVDDVELHVSAPPTIAVEGTVITGLEETVDTVTVTSGLLEAKFQLTVLRPITDLAGGRGSYACSGSFQTILGDDEVEVAVTREAAAFVVDSIFHDYFWVTSTITYTLEDESTRIIEGLEAVVFLLDQEPLALDFSDPIGRATAVSQSPLTYVGGPTCPGWQLTSFEPWTLIVGVTTAGR